MTNITRKSHTGESTSNPGEFGSKPRTPAPDNLLTPETDTVNPMLNFDQVERVNLSPMNRSVEFYIRRSDSSNLNLDAEYQRDSVWTLEQKQSLIRSIQMEIPTGSIVINRRPDVMEDYVVVDGKQRIEALRDFVDSKFPIPVTWVEKEEFILATEDVPGWPVPGVRYENLTIVAHRFFARKQMPSIEAQVATVEEEAEIFRLINSGGTAQTAETMAAAAAVENSGGE